MSGYKPIEFVKAFRDHKKEETTTGSDSKLPLTAENVMAEKGKVAAALARGESYDPFRIPKAFEPVASAESTSSSSQQIASNTGSVGLRKPEALVEDLAASFKPSAAPRFRALRMGSSPWSLTRRSLMMSGS